MNRQDHHQTMEIAFEAGITACNHVLSTSQKSIAWENLKIMYEKGVKFLNDPASKKLDHDKWIEQLDQHLSLLTEAQKHLK